MILIGSQPVIIDVYQDRKNDDVYVWILGQETEKMSISCYWYVRYLRCLNYLK